MALARFRERGLVRDSGRERSRSPAEPPGKWLRRSESTDLGSTRRGGDGERGEPKIDSDELDVVGSPGPVTAVCVEVGSLDIEAHIPTRALAADRGEQYLGPRRND